MWKPLLIFVVGLVILVWGVLVVVTGKYERRGRTTEGPFAYVMGGAYVLFGGFVIYKGIVILKHRRDG